MTDSASLPAPAPGPLPWERQPRESDKAWKCFTFYRDSGGERSLESTAQAFGYSSRRQVERYAERHTWRVRVVAWDAHLDALRRDAVEDEVEQMARRHATITRRTLDKFGEWLDAHDMKSMAPGEAIRMLEAAVKLERQARGAPDEPSSPAVNVQVAQGVQVQASAEATSTGDELNELLEQPGMRALLDQLAREEDTPELEGGQDLPSVPGDSPKQ